MNNVDKGKAQSLPSNQAKPEKTCGKCGQKKPADQYYKWTNTCKPCRNQQAKINRQNNIEHYRAKWKEYRNKEKPVAKHPPLIYTQLWRDSGHDPIKFTEAYKRKIKLRTNN